MFTKVTFRFSVLSMAVVSLAGCAGNAINKGTQELKVQTGTIVQQAITQQGLKIDQSTAGTSKNADARAAALQNQPVGKRASGAWYGQRTVPVLSDAVLPQIFKEKFAINFDGYRGGRVPIAVVAERLSRMSGVPVRVKQDVYAGSKNASGMANAPMPATTGLMPAMPMPVVGKAVSQTQGASVMPLQIESSNPDSLTTDIASVSMKWDGTLERFLDHVTGMLNLSWSYRDGVVVIERFITESFEITAFGGTQDYSMAISGGNSGGSGGGFGNASANLDVKESGKLAALDSLKKSLDALVVSSGGSVTLNEGSGRFTVVATKDVLSRVREVIRAEDASLRRQALIQFDVYSVTSRSSDEYGVDWSGFITDLASTWSGSIASPASLVSTAASGVTYTLLKDVPEATPQAAKNTAARYGGSKALLQALHQMGDSAQFNPVSMIAMNRQWARKTSLKTTGYVSETTPSTSSSAGSGSPGLKTATVTTGDKFLVQPAIMDDGTIYLKFGASFTNLIGLYDVTAGQGASLQRVQTPETSGTDDQGTIRLQAGEAMVITGLSRSVATSDRNGLAEEIPIALGGSKKRSYRKEEFLIVVRATPQ